uniref:Integrase, catalytic region, zinc finger, CCHC-type, peptidase aspartic, catalytic n=1 Tax=Tanacetum cinerariifolium TaxID=118510 RepID=A0A699GNG9_TANCI|nr:integrase, catalytic region, zinc finger, CCHC-type, peptidase aspartic, catalytic [Tanacetum cinerariifolium]
MFKVDSLKVMRAMLETIKLQKQGVKDSKWCKDKILLAQAGVVLNEEQHDFLADNLEKTDDYEDLQLQATENFKADHVDAYDSDCDDEAITNAIFMEMSHIGSLNDDTVEPRYDFDIYSEVVPKVVEKNDLLKSVTSHLTTNKIIVKCTKVLAPERVSSTNASGLKPRSNTKNDMIPQPSSKRTKNKVEAHHRKFKSSANKNNHMSDCNANVKNVALSKNFNTICLSCNEYLFSANHDAFVVKYLKKMQKCKVSKSVKQKGKSEWKRTRRIFTSVGLRWKPTGRMFNIEGKICPIIKTSPSTIVPLGNRHYVIRIPIVAPNAKTRIRYSVAKNSLIRAHINSYGHPFNPPNCIVLWYLDSECSKHITGRRDKLINFVSKFIRTVCFGNDHFAAIMGYGDLQMGNILILRVYYIEGLGHNLFFDGQFCDSNPGVAF